MALYDLWLNRPAQQGVLTKVEPSLGTSGELVTADIKVIQRVMILYTTEVGSMKYHPNAGSTLFELLTKGATGSDISLEIKTSFESVMNTIRTDDTLMAPYQSIPDSERIVALQLNGEPKIDSGTIYIPVAVSVASGAVHEFVIPLSSPVR